MVIITFDVGPHLLSYIFDLQNGSSNGSVVIKVLQNYFEKLLNETVDFKYHIISKIIMCTN